MGQYYNTGWYYSSLQYLGFYDQQCHIVHKKPIKLKIKDHARLSDVELLKQAYSHIRIKVFQFSIHLTQPIKWLPAKIFSLQMCSTAISPLTKCASATFPWKYTYIYNFPQWYWVNSKCIPQLLPTFLNVVDLACYQILHQMYVEYTTKYFGKHRSMQGCCLVLISQPPPL